MDSGKILFCYRDDKIKKPTLYETEGEMRLVAALPCTKTKFGKQFILRQKLIKKYIVDIYEVSEAEYLWLDDALSEFLQMEQMDLPEILVERWLEKIPFFFFFFFADDKKGRAANYICQRTDRLAAVCVVCYDKNITEYENLAGTLLQKEGIFLQIFTYEMLSLNPKLFEKNLNIKGRSAVLDFEENKAFWDKRLLKDMSYYSFLKEIRLFLDTFRKNRYNTLTK